MLNLKPLKNGKIVKAQANSARIREVWDLATLSEIEEGMSWYDDARRIAETMDSDNVYRAAGVIAALSPRLDWGRNVMLAQRAYEAFEQDPAMPGHKWGTLGTNADKAYRILKGENPDDVLKGDKVTAFYRAIVDGSGVVIDRHAFDVAMGRVTNDETRGALSRKGVYDQFAARYIIAASKLTDELDEYVSPAQVQAVTWVVWRRLKNLPEHVTFEN